MAKDKEKKENEEKDVAPKGKSKKKLIYIGVGAVLLLGGIIGVMAMGGGEDEAPAEESAPETDADVVVLDSHGNPVENESADAGAKADAGSGANSDIITGATDYLFQSEFSVNIFDGNRSSILQMQLHVMTNSPETVMDLKANVAPARDAIIMLLSSKSLDDIRTTDDKVRLKQEIIRRLNAEFGAGAIRDVNFTKFLIFQ